MKFEYIVLGCVVVAVFFVSAGLSDVYRRRRRQARQRASAASRQPAIVLAVQRPPVVERTVIIAATRSSTYIRLNALSVYFSPIHYFYFYCSKSDSIEQISMKFEVLYHKRKSSIYI